MKFIVNGGEKLEGAIEVRGFKNAATPILAATILTERPCVIKNLPLIGDVLKFIEIMEEIGSDVEWIGKRSVRIVNKNINPSSIDRTLVRRMRSSVLLMGPILARFGEISISTPGGCYIGVRPMDAHIGAFEEAGFECEYDEKAEMYHIKKSKNNGKKEISLSEFSVTATENILMLASYKGGMKIKIAAAEPNVQDLGKFLQKLGSEIDGLGSHEITISNSVKKTGGEIEHEIINDPIEAGTFMALAGATKSDIQIKGVPVSYLTMPIQKLREFGVVFDIKGDDIYVKGSASKLRAVKKIMTLPYPGFPTDLQAPFGILATQSEGETLIFETLYEGRFKYLDELKKMGADAKILDLHQAIIKGPTKLKGSEVESIDLRAGATLIVAALVAEGESVLHTAEQIDRGYEKIEERLKLIGANIKRTD